MQCIVIETSKDLRFGCWDVCYAGLAAQFRATKWLGTDATNYYDKIYDFSPVDKGKTPNWSVLPGIDPNGRWCQLSITPEGLCGGSVVETRSDVPSVEGCECPIAAQDGTLFASAWYDAKADLAAAAADAAAAAEAKAVVDAGDIALVGLPSKKVSVSDDAAPGLLRRALNWLFGKKEKGRASAYAAEPAAATGSGGKQTTQVCIVS